MSSCCTKKECYNDSGIVTFEGYSIAELDSCKIILEVKDQTLEEVFPDSTLFRSNSDSTYSFYFEDVFVSAAQVSIRLKDGSVFIANDFKYEERRCNKCYPVGEETFNFLKDYYLNDVQQVYDGKILIRKEP